MRPPPAGRSPSWPAASAPRRTRRRARRARSPAPTSSQQHARRRPRRRRGAAFSRATSRAGAPGHHRVEPAEQRRRDVEERLLDHRRAERARARPQRPQVGDRGVDRGVGRRRRRRRAAPRRGSPGRRARRAPCRGGRRAAPGRDPAAPGGTGRRPPAWVAMRRPRRSPATRIAGSRWSTVLVGEQRQPDRLEPRVGGGGRARQGRVELQGLEEGEPGVGERASPSRRPRGRRRRRRRGARGSLAAPAASSWRGGCDAARVQALLQARAGDLEEGGGEVLRALRGRDASRRWCAGPRPAARAASMPSAAAIASARRRLFSVEGT